mmetsp:Transcript_12927/g.19445  ORF Transcript_12927/g.19445 Transcript_12927/m.19445 type:complete len:173 (+) Transcript_12927:169-687(+)|eukprot:CAMPEP_0185017130 /NCGR_PEP_ID=MMETSP1103-20130426/90_1 /TAXON_ID=36769 /ORGANISM="Paraphysomonas bandaiensis, Strain Caron Lab Isolate" /LENGTH=172 /DNA_ID=CAMNT_0027546393 /DNA_START=164 /DNA_END=682 /DNA_ORIENTATION=+
MMCDEERHFKELLGRYDSGGGSFRRRNSDPTSPAYEESREWKSIFDSTNYDPTPAVRRIKLPALPEIPAFNSPKNPTDSTKGSNAGNQQMKHKTQQKARRRSICSMLPPIKEGDGDVAASSMVLKSQQAATALLATLNPKSNKLAPLPSTQEKTETPQRTSWLRMKRRTIES